MISPDVYEKLGLFYLGRAYDPKAGQAVDDPVLYDSKDLTTHAMIVGMTGSGKTGLGVTLLEEAALDGIPAIVIDPKGDLGNLLLTFPEGRPEDFEPWIDPAEATRAGQTVDQYADAVSARWHKGLADTGQAPDRVARLRDAAEAVLYTPGSDAGRQLTVLRSFSPPGGDVPPGSDLWRESLGAAVAGLLTLLGSTADPLASREFVLLSQILDTAWRAGAGVDLPGLIRAIQKPPFNRIGVMDVEDVYPAADRTKLAMTLNNLLASPTFQGWLTGEPLDVDRLLYSPGGRPRLAVISIAHLTDEERMFFVTLLLSEVIAWMRRQAGTSSLRAILYMDEVFGYLPPTANPPSKIPLLTLLKQARAFGLGLVLATQNPVDLDYKALSNMGTWMLGRLQTERDKLRVLDGLAGASAASGHAFDRATMDTLLSGLGGRVFLMNNVHEDAPVLFQTRWAMSYLRGPLTREQIRALAADRPATARPADAPAGVPPAEAPPTGGTPGVGALPADTSWLTGGRPGASPAGSPARPPLLGEADADLPGQADPPIVPDAIDRWYLPARPAGVRRGLLYRPALVGIGRVHFVDAKASVDTAVEVLRVATVADGPIPASPWEDALRWGGSDVTVAREPEPGARYDAVPVELTRSRSVTAWKNDLKERLYRQERLTLYTAPELGLTSTVGETEGAFRVRLRQASAEARDREVERLRADYAKRFDALQEKIRKAEQRVDRERSQANTATWTAAMQFGTSLLGAFLSRKKLSTTNVNRGMTTARAAGRAYEQRSDIDRAQDDVADLKDEVDALQVAFERDRQALADRLAPEKLTLETREIKPRRTDVDVRSVGLLWLPFTIRPDGLLEAAYDAPS